MELSDLKVSVEYMMWFINWLYDSDWVNEVFDFIL